MMTTILICILVVALYVLSLQGRKGHKGLSKLQGWAYAHRGLHGPNVPENSMAAFRAAVEAGYGAELDVHLLRDGRLAVFHDFSLQRVAGAEVRIEELTAPELANYRLSDTQEQIPLFEDVLALFAGKAPLIVELKVADNNYEALTKAVCQMLDQYKVTYCIESFDPRCIRWLKKYRPDVIRGQLADNSLRNKHANVLLPLRFIMTYSLLNFLTRPDFLAYKFAHRKNLSNFLVRRLWGVQGVAWTLTARDSFDEAVKEGWLPIFEGFCPDGNITE